MIELGCTSQITCRMDLSQHNSKTFSVWHQPWMLGLHLRRACFCSSCLKYYLITRSCLSQQIKKELPVNKFVLDKVGEMIPTFSWKFWRGTRDASIRWCARGASKYHQKRAFTRDWWDDYRISQTPSPNVSTDSSVSSVKPCLGWSYGPNQTSMDCRKRICKPCWDIDGFWPTVRYVILTLLLRTRIPRHKLTGKVQKSCHGLAIKHSIGNHHVTPG